MRKVTEEGRRQTAKERRRSAVAEGGGGVSKPAPGHRPRHSVASPLTIKGGKSERKERGPLG